MPTRVPVPVPTRAPTDHTNAYLAGRDGAVLVDPADWPLDASDAPDATDAASRTGAVREVDVGDVAHVAVTHAHPDHVGGVADAVAATGATAWAHARHADRFAEATGVRPDRTFREGDDVGGLTVVETPGHARDHVAFREGDDYLSGDLAFADGSAFVGGDGADMRAYLTSLRRLHARDPRRLHPGHGPPVERPRERLAALVAHRTDRERRVERAVRGGATTVDAVLDAAYEKDLGGVRDLAALTVEAHLAKLARAGRVRWDPETGAAAPPA